MKISLVCVEVWVCVCVCVLVYVYVFFLGVVRFPFLKPQTEGEMTSILSVWNSWPLRPGKQPVYLTLRNSHKILTCFYCGYRVTIPNI